FFDHGDFLVDPDHFLFRFSNRIPVIFNVFVQLVQILLDGAFVLLDFFQLLFHPIPLVGVHQTRRRDRETNGEDHREYLLHDTLPTVGLPFHRAFTPARNTGTPRTLGLSSSSSDFAGFRFCALRNAGGGRWIVRCFRWRPCTVPCGRVGRSTPGRCCCTCGRRRWSIRCRGR